ncbi:L-serine ammonia-lyase [Novosphingobium olei]|uniref:L-serine ammonia-lyase n=1 Tax=Novosphingobium olei TaxID=2728851 RepID=UPI0030CC3141
MTASLFDIFKVGVGPSSSHTMGPMTAACRFVEGLEVAACLTSVARVEVSLYASLALTGKGHATDRAVIAGLSGIRPETCQPDAMAQVVDRAMAGEGIALAGRHTIGFSVGQDLLWRGAERLAYHPNGLQFRAFDTAGSLFGHGTYYSIGGGFVLDESEALASQGAQEEDAGPYPFISAAQLVAMAEKTGLGIAGIMLANEDALRPRGETMAGLVRLTQTMDQCIERGMRETGILPGGLDVRRRAAQLRARIEAKRTQAADPLAVLDEVNLWAIAVNEENAAGGVVVTAPTNGAAGIIPAVLRFAARVADGQSDYAATFLLTAAAIGALFKRNASISAAEVGCQGEVGVACAMAAAGLCAVMGGTSAQIENAAEIGMEHNLGLTCDPIGGLVQIPCIERNAMGAVKAIDAARLALAGNGQHHVSLDQVIETMRRTGADMLHHYKETSLGGLAVCVPEC